MDGTLLPVIQDQPNRRSAVTQYVLQTPTGSLDLVPVNQQIFQGIKAGSRVRATGMQSGAKLMLNTAPDILSAPMAIATIGVRKSAISFVNYSDNQSQPISQATASQGLVLLNQYFQEVSFGQLSASGDVYGYLQLPLSIQETCVDDAATTIINAGFQAAKNVASIFLPIRVTYS